MKQFAVNISFILLIAIIGCGPQNNKVDSSKKANNLSNKTDDSKKSHPLSTADEQAIRSLESEIATINLDNYVMNTLCSGQGSGQKSCFEKVSEHFNTKEKRDILNKKAVDALIEAAKANLDPKMLANVVKDAKDASELKGVSIVTLTDHTTKDALAFLHCMALSEDNFCFINLHKKLN